jgi:hypothetical protein
MVHISRSFSLQICWVGVVLKFMDSCTSIHIPPFICGPGSSVGKATGWTVRGSNPGGGEIFRTCPDRPWGPPRILCNRYRVFPGGKERPGCDADPSSPFSAVVKKEKSYTSTPPTGHMACAEPQCLYKGCTLPLPFPFIYWCLQNLIPSLWYSIEIISISKSLRWCSVIHCKFGSSEYNVFDNWLIFPFKPLMFSW